MDGEPQSGYTGQHIDIVAANNTSSHTGGEQLGTPLGHPVDEQGDHDRHHDVAERPPCRLAAITTAAPTTVPWME